VSELEAFKKISECWKYQVTKLVYMSSLTTRYELTGSDHAALAKVYGIHLNESAGASEAVGQALTADGLFVESSTVKVNDNGLIVMNSGCA
jgi:hypothetical protein